MLALPYSMVTNASSYTGSVALKTDTKHAQFHYYRNLALRISQQSFAVGGSDGTNMYSVPHPASNLSQTFWFPELERLRRPRKTWSECVKIGVSYFGLAAIEPQDRQHPRLKLDVWLHLIMCERNMISNLCYLSLHMFTRSTLECRATLGHFRSIKPNMINHFAN